MRVLGFRVWALGFRVWGLGFRYVLSLGFVGLYVLLGWGPHRAYMASRVWGLELVACKGVHGTGLTSLQYGFCQLNFACPFVVLAIVNYPSSAVFLISVLITNLSCLK